MPSTGSPNFPPVPPPLVVTISASYGAGGSVVAPAVAERLGLMFADRAIPVAVADAMAVPLNDALARDEHSPSILQRILSAMATSGMEEVGVAPLPESRNPVHAHEAETRKAIRELAASGAVILGRAGAFVLAKHPGALHVRLDGPEEARILRATQTRAVDEKTARQRLESSDRARLAYVRHFHRADATDPKHYHLWITSTAFPIEACVDLIVAAAEARATPL